MSSLRTPDQLVKVLPHQSCLDTYSVAVGVGFALYRRATHMLLAADNAWSCTMLVVANNSSVSPPDSSFDDESITFFETKSIHLLPICTSICIWLVHERIFNVHFYGHITQEKEIWTANIPQPRSGDKMSWLREHAP
jgi:hypothetical protein